MEKKERGYPDVYKEGLGEQRKGGHPDVYRIDSYMTASISMGFSFLMGKTRDASIERASNPSQVKSSRSWSSSGHPSHSQLNSRTLTSADSGPSSVFQADTLHKPTITKPTMGPTPIQMVLPPAKLAGSAMTSTKLLISSSAEPPFSSLAWSSCIMGRNATSDKPSSL